MELWGSSNYNRNLLVRESIVFQLNYFFSSSLVGKNPGFEILDK
jgi:hypothetical protein